MTKKKITKKELHILPKFDFKLTNMVIFFIGVLFLIIGFVFMAQGPWDNPLSLTVAPIVLLIAYVVIFPLALFWGFKAPRSSEDKSEK